MRPTDFTEHWLGALLKLNRRPMSAADCPNCSGVVLEPQIDPLDELLVSCPGCGWSVTLRSLLM